MFSEQEKPFSNSCSKQTVAILIINCKWSDSNGVMRYLFLALLLLVWSTNLLEVLITAQEANFSIKNYFSKCDQIRRKLRIWSHLPTKSLMKNFIFCAVTYHGGWGRRGGEGRGALIQQKQSKQSNKIYLKSAIKLSRTSKAYRHGNFEYFQILQVWQRLQ